MFMNISGHIKFYSLKFENYYFEKLMHKMRLSIFRVLMYNLILFHFIFYKMKHCLNCNISFLRSQSFCVKVLLQVYLWHLEYVFCTSVIYIHKSICVCIYLYIYIFFSSLCRFQIFHFRIKKIFGTHSSGQMPQPFRIYVISMLPSKWLISGVQVQFPLFC